MSPADRRRLEALVEDRNVAQKHVWRARIVLHSADGIGTNGIMRRTGKSKTCVWRWQERFAQEGYDGLLRDKTRPSRIPPLGPEVAERVVALTLSDPPAEATHWVAAMMAKATGISVSSVQRIEGFFAKLSKRRLKRGVFRSIVDLQVAINRFLDETNDNPKPFTWTADPDKIIAAVKRGHQVLDSIH